MLIGNSRNPFVAIQGVNYDLNCDDSDVDTIVDEEEGVDDRNDDGRILIHF